MNPQLVKVFVYGTLLPGQNNHFIAAPFITGKIEEGYIQARLVDAGAYPAAVRDAGSKYVRGAWLTVSLPGLAAMDRLEEFAGIEELNDYERIWVADAWRTDNAGWVYVWTDDRDCPPVLRGGTGKTSQGESFRYYSWI
ncbi:gamma-glutamylcyclotransferase [Paenibacillus sp. NEAU-GSW1]|uniref:gamma-glutamylcyclotransferase family protein n=1 Tax=Paenibacillus sp. NEAU-GSW1 TaxID=2682486 RepID=UPI0012E11783|nr:gamma-glutamylcyclotransferase family protein [Paenibacillus sp. NEAU-GSW1]MUT67124.1 gamma-glutamylcyclotransferase [Paenibacillus sp. NEAU-GSW1]